jgi:hypothetical protein
MKFRIIGKLSLDRFELALKESPYRFSDKYIKDIINDAPKTKRNDISYRDLYFTLAVTNLISNF